MKIGIISTIGDAYSWAGSEEMWRGVANEALKRENGIVVCAAKPIAESRQAREMANGGAVFVPRANLNPLTRRLAVRNLYSRYTRFFKYKHDVLCVSMGGIGDCVWMPDLLKHFETIRIPYIVIVQANAEGLIEDEVSRCSLRSFYGQARGVVFVSEHNRELAERQLGMCFENAIVLPNPLRSEVTVPVPWPTEVQGFRIAEVARLELVDKQQDHLLKALSGRVWKERDWKLTFFGSGADEVHLRRLIDFYGLARKVEIGGFVADFQDIWRDNHLQVLPSRREGMPLSLIESMACGRPAVVTRAGGSAELVEHDKNGWICPGMHPEVLAETLETAWQNRHRWRDMGLAARDRVMQLQKPDWASRILQIVEQASDHRLGT